MINQLVKRNSNLPKTSPHKSKGWAITKAIKTLALMFGAMLLLSGCSDVISMHPKGVIASEQKELFIISVLLMLIVVIPVIILTVVFAYRYRASNKKATYKPKWAHNTLLEIIWWTIPCIIIVILAVITWITTHSLDPYKPLITKDNKKPIVIEVVSLDWKWLFVYPEEGIATVNHIEFPTNRQISFKITADSPMTSFIIPQLGGQIYAMAGMQTQLHLLANVPGKYYGFNANYSGEGFAGMNFIATATNEKQYKQWIDQVKASKNHLTMNTYEQLRKPSKDVPVTYYSTVVPKLYHHIVMSYMMPPEDMIEKNLKKDEAKF